MLSDSLAKLIEPYTNWPPDPSELDQLLSDLCFGGQVWNITLTTPDSTTCQQQLKRLVSKHFDPKDHHATLQIAKELVERKKTLFPEDNRLIVKVRVANIDNQPVVFALGAFWS
jgi:hypothetical protein